MATIIGDDDTILNIERVIAMTTTDGEKKQLNIQNRICLAVCSELRRKILVALRDDKKALRELRKTVDVSSTTAIHALRDLEKANLIYQDEARKYALTTIGEIITLKMVDFVDAVDVLQKHEEFWLDHDLSGIPPHMMEKIGWLHNSNVVKIDALDIIKAHTTYISCIEKAKWVKGASSIYSPDYPVVFEELVTKNINTHLILTESVFNKVIDTVGPETIKSLTSDYHFKVFVTEEEVKMAFTVTDAFLSLGLFTFGGTYDNTCDLIGTDDRAIRWGADLFEYYRKKAKIYEI